MIPAGSRSRIELVVAGNGPTIGLAATLTGDGWATTGPESENVTTDEWWSRVAGRPACSTRPRTGRAGMPRYLNLDSAPVLSISSLGAFTDAAGRAAALGFTDAVIHWPRPAGVYAGDEAVLDEIAG